MVHVSFISRQQLARWWGWMLLTTLALALLTTSRYFVVADLDNSPPALLFRIVMLVAHFATLSALLLVPLLLLLLLWPRPGLVVPAGIACCVLVLVGLLIDTQVYQLYRFHINAGVLNLLLGGAARETFVFGGEVYLGAGIGVAAVVVVAVVAGVWWWHYVRSNPGNRVVPCVIIIALCGSITGFHGAHVWADVVAFRPVLEQTEVLPLRYAATAKRLLRTLGVDVRPAPVLRAAGPQDPTVLAYPLDPLVCRPAGRPPNIIIILIDSWRFDALNAEVTPQIDRFARRAVRFMDHHSGGNATRIGVFSLFYSIPGTYWHRMLAQRRGPVFIEQLLEHRYDLQVFRSAPLFSPEFDRTVFAQVERPRLRSDGGHPAQRDHDLTDDFIEFLRSRWRVSPFFALLFYDAPHSLDVPPNRLPVFQPSAPGVNYLGLHAATDAMPLLNRYYNSLHYVDELAGRALAELESHGLLEHSVVVITGDHGQEFNDNGRNYWGHGSNYTRYQTGVPLLLYAPNLAPAIHRHRTTHFDVVPTLLREYLGCGQPSSIYSVGRSLFEPGGRDTMVLSEYADFAIVRADRIVVVREQGMEVRDHSYAKLHGQRLEPEVIAEVLEQKTRFHRGGGASRK